MCLLLVAVERLRLFEIGMVLACFSTGFGLVFPLAKLSLSVGYACSPLLLAALTLILARASEFTPILGPGVILVLFF